MLSTRPKDSVGSDEIWSNATAALRGALESKGWAYGIDEGNIFCSFYHNYANTLMQFAWV